MAPPPYATFFSQTADPAGPRRPHGWQLRLGEDNRCQDRVIRIPTGFGKTAGTVLPWLYHRVVHQDSSWPLRLCFVLPMRTLVEQVHQEVQRWLKSPALAGRVELHVLMGGVESAQWRLAPERPQILIATQDMALSRALNRGYGAGRAVWPMEFGLLHHDCLWVFDEVQLQDVGLATSTQLAAFRLQNAARRAPARPTYSWWMSATLQPRWLKSVDFATQVDALARDSVSIPPEERTGGLWSVKKAVARVRRDEGLATPDAIAKQVAEAHAPGTLTLCVVNTVDRAIKVHAALETALRPATARGRRGGRTVPRIVEPVESQPDLRLVHSRFRGAERRSWSDSATGFLTRDAPLPPGGRIVVATQVVEAGVDLSAALLVTDLAPWPSLVQRFGRCARREGEEGRIVVAGDAPDDEKKARPYEVAGLSASARFLDRLIESQNDGSPSALERFEDSLSDDERSTLYPYSPRFVLRRRDLDGLFDTSTDLDGADVDIGRFIRNAEERDGQVFWRSGLDPSKPPEVDRFDVHRDELCPIPLQDLRELLEKRPGFVFDYLDGSWKRADRFRLYAGVQVLLRSEDGGYLESRGLVANSKDAVPPVPTSGARADPLELASWSDEEDALSVADWKSVGVHGRETAGVAISLARQMMLRGDQAAALEFAARWHDVGKVHETFQSAIRDEERLASGGETGRRRDLAKAPASAWRRPAYPQCPGFRHELASTLALFELLRRTAPDHPALRGSHLELLKLMAEDSSGFDSSQESDELGGHPIAEELKALDPETFDLVAFLVCAHHGKVRCAWAPTALDRGGAGTSSNGVRIHGVAEGDALPAFELSSRDGTDHPVPELRLSLAMAEVGIDERFGASWTERIANLIRSRGPFELAYLEAVLRCADAIASGARPAAQENAS